MSYLSSTRTHETKTATQQELLGPRVGADIATQHAATVWRPHWAHAAPSGLGKTGYSNSGVHPAPPGGITNNCITSDSGRSR